MVTSTFELHMTKIIDLSVCRKHNLIVKCQIINNIIILDDVSNSNSSFYKCFSIY